MKKKVFSYLLACAVAMSTMATVACTPQQKLAVVTDIQKFLPVVTNVANAVCGFTPAATVCLGGVTAVSASAGILDTALVNYFTAQANGTVPPGVIAALAQAIGTFETDAGNILDSVRVLNPTLQTEIESLAAAAQVLLAVVEGLLPSVGQTAKFAASKPANFDLNVFVVDYNAKVAASQKLLPRNIALKKVHVHSVVARYATAGWLK
jgi:hypothetical protein